MVVVENLPKFPHLAENLSLQRLQIYLSFKRKRPASLKASITIWSDLFPKEVMSPSACSVILFRWRMAPREEGGFGRGQGVNEITDKRLSSVLLNGRYSSIWRFPLGVPSHFYSRLHSSDLRPFGLSQRAIPRSCPYLAR
ncbi:hypothetical protein RRG08_001586 [Elysia crispata]|uniref:Uncharacterized protein n=1 Tax=Elysia crispata TaxID=231223 RepID=A0AAE1E0M0_9GAST|nr:hypothetical protein RRG08_001586 [Elysia crispata]